MRNTTTQRYSLPQLCLLLPALLLAGCRITVPDRLASGSPASYQIHSEGSGAEQVDVAVKVDLVLAHYRDLFMIDAATVPPLSIHLGAEADWYGSGEFPALYEPATQSIRFRRKPDTMLLLHEIAHHFIQAACGEVPVWLNEGVATYLGWSAMDTDHLLTGEIPVSHFRTMQKMARDGTLRPLDEFLSLTGKEFYTFSASADHYAQAWGLVYYLFHGKFKDLRSFRGKLDSVRRMPPGDLIALDSSFQRFFRGFSALQLMRERLKSGVPLQRMSSAFRLGIYQDASALDPLLAIAQDRNREMALRTASLHAAAMIMLNGAARHDRDRFRRVLQRLVARAPVELAQTSRALLDCVDRVDTQQILQRFAALNQDGTFYPAARFVVGIPHE